jgi:hypothetical protein
MAVLSFLCVEMLRGSGSVVGAIGYAITVGGSDR